MMLLWWDDRLKSKRTIQLLSLTRSLAGHASCRPPKLKPEAFQVVGLLSCRPPQLKASQFYHEIKIFALREIDKACVFISAPVHTFHLADIPKLVKTKRPWHQNKSTLIANHSCPFINQQPFTTQDEVLQHRSRRHCSSWHRHGRSIGLCGLSSSLFDVSGCRACRCCPICGLPIGLCPAAGDAMPLNTFI